MKRRRCRRHVEECAVASHAQLSKKDVVRQQQLPRYQGQDLHTSASAPAPVCMREECLHAEQERRRCDWNFAAAGTTRTPCAVLSLPPSHQPARDRIPAACADLLLPSIHPSTHASAISGIAVALHCTAQHSTAIIVICPLHSSVQYIGTAGRVVTNKTRPCRRAQKTPRSHTSRETLPARPRPHGPPRQ